MIYKEPRCRKAKEIVSLIKIAEDLQREQESKEIVSLVKAAEDLQRVQKSKRNCLLYKNSGLSTKTARKKKKSSPL